MVDALSVVDGIGLGRPLCQEPYLCSQILAGKVHGSVAIQLSQYDFLTTATASMLQIRQIANSQQPINLGLKESAPLFYQAVQELMASREKDTTGEVYMAPLVQGWNKPLTSAVI